MQHLIVFKFDNGYSPHHYRCNVNGRKVEELAAKTWKSAGGYTPFWDRTIYLERPLTSSDVETLRKLFYDRVEKYHPRSPDDPKFDPRYDTVEEYNKFVNNGCVFSDEQFLEFSEFNDRWDVSFTIYMIFELAKIQDPSIQYEEANDYETISL